MTDYRGRGLPVYAVGTITGTSGSAIITGSGTAWLGTDENGLTFNNVGAGDLLIVGTSVVPIQSVQSATQLTLEWNLASNIAAGSSYRIIRYAPNPTGFINRALAALEERLSRLYADDGGRLVFRTVSGGQRLSYLPPGSSTYTDLLAIANDDLFSVQKAPVAKNSTATLVAADLLARIITSNATATLTLPTGSALDTGFANMGVDFAFDVSFINTGAGTVTIAGNTGVTIVGATTIAAGKSAAFRLRKTATATWVAYCIANA